MPSKWDAPLAFVAVVAWVIGFASWHAKPPVEPVKIAELRGTI